MILQLQFLFHKHTVVKTLERERAVIYQKRPLRRLKNISYGMTNYYLWRSVDFISHFGYPGQSLVVRHPNVAFVVFVNLGNEIDKGSFIYLPKSGRITGLYQLQTHFLTCEPESFFAVAKISIDAFQFPQFAGKVDQVFIFHEADPMQG